MQIANLKIIITGAASGLGASAAKCLAREGATVVAVDIDRAGLEALQAEVKANGGQITIQQADISVEQDAINAVKQAVAEHGTVNALINSAGIYRDGLLVHADGRKLPLAQWRKVLDVDLTGTFLMTREVAAHMVSAKVAPGVIINIASISRHGNVAQGNYAAAKAAVVADTRTWARELARYGIRVAAVSPGLIKTPILAEDLIDPGVLADYVSRIPLGRLGEPREIDSAIKFIIDCDYFTGECVEVNGGFLF
ncbi:MAG TPA: SDR family oxidoreductase [Kofleriaceae bacterium]|jgi:3-oxoacyl-[acyl-carrier protein] reductase|nr:SDR family oxidoreductase [Kofleriaceae bacterium]